MGTEPFDSSQLLRGTLDLAVMSVIATGEAYGYEIARRIWGSGLSDVREPSIYGTLNRLFRNGLLTARVESSASGPHRKYYALTTSGMAYLRAGRDEWVRTRIALDELLEAVFGPGGNPHGCTGSSAQVTTAPSAAKRSSR